jgi:hypothetical protein
LEKLAGNLLILVVSIHRGFPKGNTAKAVLNAVLIIKTERAIEPVVPSVSKDKEEYAGSNQAEDDATKIFHGECSDAIPAGNGSPVWFSPVLRSVKSCSAKAAKSAKFGNVFFVSFFASFARPALHRVTEKTPFLAVFASN